MLIEGSVLRGLSHQYINPLIAVCLEGTPILVYPHCDKGNLKLLLLNSRRISNPVSPPHTNLQPNISWQHLYLCIPLTLPGFTYATISLHGYAGGQRSSFLTSQTHHTQRRSSPQLLVRYCYLLSFLQHLCTDYLLRYHKFT